MKRFLEPELLDALPPRHPDAVAGRRDLRRINRLMGNFRWFSRVLPPLLRPGDRVLELGAGQGDVSRAVAAKWRRTHASAPPPRFTGLDLGPRPADWPREWEWHQTDLADFSELGEFRVVIGNLFFHHLDAAALRHLGRRMEGADLFLASEPARRRFHQWQIALLKPLRFNPVTWHDAHISIAAGFLGDELPRFLGLSPDAWTWNCRNSLFGSHRIVARRHRRS